MCTIEFLRIETTNGQIEIDARLTRFFGIKRDEKMKTGKEARQNFTDDREFDSCQHALGESRLVVDHLFYI